MKVDVVNLIYALLSIIGIAFIVMLIDELRTNYKIRKYDKEIIGEYK